MAEVVIQGERIVFPPICPVCQMPATHVYGIQKKLVVPGLTQWVRFNIGYCAQHSAQLIEADKRVSRISLGLYALLFVIWVALAYLAILIFPELKFIQGDTITAWTISLALAMCALGILVAPAGGAMVVSFGLRILPTITRHIVDTQEVKHTRSALSIKSFDMPIPLTGKARVRSTTFSIVDPKYAEQFHRLNEGTNLV